MAVICALCCKKMVRIQERTNVNIRPVFNYIKIFFIFIQKSHQPDENVFYIFIRLMAFNYEQTVNAD